MNVIALVVIAALVEMFLHYFPWRLALRGRRLPRLASYTLGVLGLMVPYTAWLVGQGALYEASVLWMVIAAGGVSVGGLYALDWVINLAWDKHQGEQREKLLTEEIHGKGKSA